MKNIFSIITTTIILSLFLKPASFAKDREYKFSFNGYVSEEIANQDDYALMEAAKYTLKKSMIILL